MRKRTSYIIILNAARQKGEKPFRGCIHCNGKHLKNQRFDCRYESPLQGRTSRGVSGALYLQSAPAGMNSVFRAMAVQQGYASSDERLVLRNGAP